MRSKWSLKTVAPLFAGLLGTVIACGDSAAPSEFGTAATGGAGGTSGTGGRGGANDAGADSTTTQDDAGFGTTDSATGTDPDALIACATETAAAKPFPLDMYVMMDSSGSMQDPTSSGPTKWEAVKTALTAFVQEPQSTGIGMAMQFFPLLYPNVPATCTASSECGTHGPCELKACGPTPGQTTQPSYIACDSTNDCPANRTCLNLCECSSGGTYYMPSGSGNVVGCAMGAGTCTRITSSSCADGNSCDAAQYDTPAVPLSQLPASANDIIQAMNRTPRGSTPTAPALRGAITRAQEIARANPTHATIALVVTDGLPTVCSPLAISDIATIAEGGLQGDAGAGTPGVKTFVVGVFTDAEANEARTNLNAIAQKGGTNSAFIITTTQNVAQQFLAALNTVRASALPCDYEVPRPDSGMPDFEKVNVQFTAGSGAKETLPYVASVGGCASVGRGWYYDVNPSSGATPTKISMCPDICTSLKADTNGKVDVLLGCKTSIR